MIWRNTIDRYGSVHKFLHWLIALSVIAMLAVGWWMGGLERGPDKMQIYSIHKALGVTILALMILRVLWRAINWNRPQPLQSHARWERLLAGLVHGGLYALLIAMPLSGWLMTAAANSTVNWFGLFPIPNPIGPNENLAHVLRDLHGFLPFVIVGLLVLHVAGALKHQFIDHDSTLRRMLPFAAVAMLLLPINALADDPIPVWTIDRGMSKLGFEATQEGSPFQGSFERFSGMVRLDPAHPETGNAAVLIDLTSVNSQNAERDASLKEKEWFDVASSATAAYHVDSFVKGDKPDSYVAKGRLALRGLERPLDLPFTMTMEEKDNIKTAHVVGETAIDRLTFGLGDGKWADPGMVGHQVKVRVDVNMTSKLP